MRSDWKQAPYGGHPGFAEVFRSAWRRSLGSISLVIMGICTALFLGVAVLDATGAVTRRDALTFLGLSYVGLFELHWLHQFVTAPLLHAGVAHLLFNMLSLWMLGPSVEKSLGKRNYVVFSALCAGASMGGFLLLNWGTGAVVTGYSGVIFGILVAQALLFPERRIAVFAFFPLKMKHAALLLGAVELYLTVSPESGGVAHAAHLFGAAAALGYLKGPAWYRKAASRLRSPAAGATPRKPRRRGRHRDVPRKL